MIWWLAGAVVVASLLFLAWAASKLTSRLPRLQRLQRRLNETAAAGQASLTPRLADLQARVTDLQVQAEELTAALASRKRAEHRD
jgi:hypothetical protein